MKNSILIICLLHLLLVISCNKDERTIATGTAGDLTWTLNSKGTLTISGTGEIPDYYDSSPPWGPKERITAVVINNGVTYIGNRAFFLCKNLISVTIPSSVTDITHDAFEGCFSLISIDVDNSNNVYCSENGILFAHAKASLIRYPGGKTDAHYTIPNSVTVIYSNAFDYCCSLTSITIPNSARYIYSGAFEGCSGLTSITIPNSVTYIGYQAFKDCRGLTSVTIGNSVISIGSSAFEDCRSLTSITIPNSVTHIEYYAFAYCRSLTSVTIGNSVTYIRDAAFGGCYNITEIINKSVTPQVIEASVFGGVISTCTLRVPAASLEAYRTARNWKNFENIVAIE